MVTMAEQGIWTSGLSGADEGQIDNIVMANLSDNKDWLTSGKGQSSASAAAEPRYRRMLTQYKPSAPEPVGEF